MHSELCMIVHDAQFYCAKFDNSAMKRKNYMPAMGGQELCRNNCTKRLRLTDKFTDKKSGGNFLKTR